jgi:Fe-S-cluster-containing dehydrogenase component
MTNFEKITQSPESLIEAMTNHEGIVLVAGCGICVGCENCDEYCPEGVKQWLNQEAESEVKK